MEKDYKKIHRNILKLTHPDNCEKYTSSLPAGVKKYLDMLRNEADQAYEDEDFERLDEIYAELTGESEPKRQGTSTSGNSYYEEDDYEDDEQDEDYEEETEDALDIADFFREYKLEVLDKREKGGALWVIGTKSSIGNIVDLAIKRYGIKGTYSDGGRTTKGRAAWWTK